MTISRKETEGSVQSGASDHDIGTALKCPEVHKNAHRFRKVLDAEKKCTTRIPSL